MLMSLKYTIILTALIQIYFWFISGWRSILLGRQLCDKGPETSAINHTADNFTGKEGLKTSSKKQGNLKTDLF